MTTSHRVLACLLVLSAALCGVMYLRATSSGSASASEALTPWIATAKANCRAYEEQANEIGKSAVYRDLKSFPVGQRIAGVPGVLKSLRTDQGGDEVSIKVSVAGVTLVTEDDAQRGSPLYEQVTTLREGQCVVVAATVTAVDSVLEHSVMCDLDYRAQFETISACPD